MNNLEYRSYESFIINETVKAARYASDHDYDAMVIGCFYDPALHDAREISGNTIIIAPCQASIVTALNIANNFSILIGKTKWENQMRQSVYEYGYRDKLASFQPVDMRVAEFHKDPARTRKRLQAAAVEAVQVHKAESIILGCTLEIGFYRELQDYLNGPEAFPGAGIPVIDPSIAAFKAAENAAFIEEIRLAKQQVREHATTAGGRIESIQPVPGGLPIRKCHTRAGYNPAINCVSQR